MDPILNEKPVDGSSPEQAMPVPMAMPMPGPTDQPPAYNSEWTAPPNMQYAPVGVPAAGSQAVYPPPVQGGYPPPAQGSAYPPTQGHYPPPQGTAYPPTQYQYNGYSQPSGPTTVTGTTTSQVIIRARTCPKCESGIMQEQFTACGILCAIFFFPFGVFCCLAMREYRCSYCNALF